MKATIVVQNPEDLQRGLWWEGVAGLVIGDEFIPKENLEIFGVKPRECPLSFKTCADCNVYPCVLGEPAKGWGAQ